MNASLLNRLDRSRLPCHIAMIMDGNGRWAKERGMPRLYGHKAGVDTVREITETCAELGISYLTLYAFSTENWNRPLTEVTGLMNLLVQTVKKEIGTLNKNGIKLRAIGNLAGLPEKTRQALEEGIRLTAENTRLDLILALNYSARWEILHAVNQIAEKVKRGDLLGPIDQQCWESELTTAGIPDPELLIRTSVKTEFPISCFGNWHTVSYILQSAIGPNFAVKNSMKPFWIIKTGNADLVKYPSKFNNEPHLPLCKLIQQWVFGINFAAAMKRPWWSFMSFTQLEL